MKPSAVIPTYNCWRRDGYLFLYHRFEALSADDVSLGKACVD